MDTSLAGDMGVAEVALRDEVVGPTDGAVGGDGHAVVAVSAVAADEDLGREGRSEVE